MPSSPRRAPPTTPLPRVRARSAAGRGVRTTAGIAGTPRDLSSRATGWTRRRPVRDDGGVTAAAPAPTPDDEARLAALRVALLAWWDRGHRDLPWRRTSDPYAVLISEAMLQQTQVERVAPRYRAFLERFPTPAALAAATPAEVIRAWAGLGYNRRAVYLHRLAREVVARHGGALPRTAAELQRLPGVGPYTARAVAAIAFGEPIAAVDTNVRRVLTRIVDGGPGGRGAAAVQALADAALARDRPGDWNQALMELGATICTAGAPRCAACPVEALCAAAPRIRAVREREGHYRAPRQTRPQGGYPHSNRFYRGRILDALRAAGPEGLAPAELGRRLRLDFTADDLPWLRRLLDGLARDGLVAWEGDGQDAVRLPT
jgi:A/G-specific adenine glycosylase